MHVYVTVYNSASSTLRMTKNRTTILYSPLEVDLEGVMVGVNIGRPLKIDLEGVMMGRVSVSWPLEIDLEGVTVGVSVGCKSKVDWLDALEGCDRSKDFFATRDGVVAKYLLH